MLSKRGLTYRPPLATDFVESLMLKIGQTCPIYDIENGSRRGEAGLRYYFALVDTTACNDVQRSRSPHSDTPYERAQVSLKKIKNIFITQIFNNDSTNIRSLKV